MSIKVVLMPAKKGMEENPIADSEAPFDLVEFSKTLRENIHSMSNALFVLKGIFPDFESDVLSHNYQQQDFDHQLFEKRLVAIGRSVNKIDASLLQLRTLAKKIPQD